MVGAVKSTFKEILGDLKPKHLAVGAAVLFITAWGFSRLLPGAAARMGLRPRPIWPAYQMGWYEPLGMIPVLPTSMNMGATAQPSATSTSGPSQAQLGQAIVAAAQASQQITSSGDILANITAGNP
jgi:hypothetical protein